ncbi:cysteine hydrolase family protein [Miltoncostaea oceani]|uniref:cysteine hydrolase family protein n=1 Tax=Miltoncostaea oceani TaxID=2843216 RepID=UPI001C3D66D8|nr:cysteine hydrolase family protein [Miltoncostaea oceani]
MSDTTSTVLLDIDTQVDFCAPEGALFVPDADGYEIRHSQAALVWWASEHGIPHIATADDHLITDPEISDEPDFASTFPPHCMRTSPGAEKVGWTRQRSPLVLGDEPLEASRLAALSRERREILILKRHFDCFTNPHTAALITELAPERVVVFGVATDVCVAAAIEGLLGLLTPAQIALVPAACAGLDVAGSKALIADWQRRGVVMSTIKQITGRMPTGVLSESTLDLE